MDWKKLLLAAGGAAGVAAVVYYLLKDQEARAQGQRPNVVGEKKRRPRLLPLEDFTKEQVQKILRDIIASQDKMKVYMKDLSKVLGSETLSFEDIYQRVQAVQPPDPLDEHGLSMNDFDLLLDRHQHDPSVRELIAKIMGAPSPTSTVSPNVQAITVKQVIEVHSFMLQELQNLNTEFHSKPNKESFDIKTVTIAAQAIVSAKIEHKYGINSEEMESAVLLYHTTLATDHAFAEVNIKIQQTMAKLMGTPFGQI